MKPKYNIAAWCMMAGVLSLAGCNNEEDTWTPGEETEVAYQVYFTCENPKAEDLDPSETSSYTLTLTRENDAEALTLPLEATGDIDVFDVPSTVDFAAGEKDATILVAFKGSENSGTYSCSVNIAPGKYNSPYTSFTTSIDISQRICNWQVYVSDLRINDYYNEALPSSYTVDLERDGNTNRYRLKGFMSNYDLAFGITENENVSNQYYIYPEGGSIGTDANGDYVWAFDDELGQTEYPLYHDLLNGGYLDYGCIFVGSDYGYTYINFANREGMIYGCFYLYGNNGSGGWVYPYFMLSWKASDETELAKEAWNR